ncbi:ABC transporter substrate-binding protein [Variovorax sp. HJSM1_2]|uniref:ABC transporter substrate-binding protein n=1 Tax=Variovorax sp. HJSM1_2 TaxID=3366263 RepID=UPI003BE04F3F
MLKLSKIATVVAVAMSAGAAFTSTAFAGEVEVLHYWTSGGEAKSAAELKKMMQAKGHVWKDFAVAGGGGDAAATVLKSRVVSGNPPAAAQIKGPAIQEWASEGVLTNLDTVAAAEKWDTLLPPVVANVMKYKGHYVAVPVNVHRVNWIWANPEVLKKAGVAGMPKTYDEFFAAADKIKAAGLIAVAHGGQNWQDFTTFESVVLGVGGAKFYQDALVKLDAKAINSDTMKKSLETFRKIKGYTDSASSGRDWNLTTALVMQGKAGFQFMGDWAKGEFLAAGKVPGKDFLCAAAPGTSSSFTFNIDSFAMFKLKSADAQKAQNDLAAAIMSPEFQETFNLNKGSIPVRLNSKMDKFDDCAKLSAKDFVETSKTSSLVPSIAHSMAVSPAAEGAIKDAVSQFWNDDKITVAAAMKNIANAAAMK